MIHTNCELPNCMLSDNLSLNDYDFVLFHLYESDETYRNYYKDMRAIHPERLMIFDNSAYEYFVQGKQLDMDKFVAAILDLKPDYYILPDVLQDKNATLRGVYKFIDGYIDDVRYRDSLLKISYPMVVAQGKTSDDLVECIQRYKRMFTSVALCLPFHIPFYLDGPYDTDIEAEFMDVYGVENEDIRYAMGRVQWIRNHQTLLEVGQNDNSGQIRYVHLLGSHCPLEKMFYNDFNSMDTGYPVKCAIENTKLGTETHKPSVIIDDFLNKDLSDQQRSLIRYNVTTFKNY